MSFSTQDITIIVVNYRTPNLTIKCIESFLQVYPVSTLLLIDNGSEDESTEYIRELASQAKNIDCILNSTNICHGPAIHQGIQCCKTRFVFTLDSDCVVHRAGFLEEMLVCFQARDLYAVGSLVRKQRYGFDALPNSRRYIPYIHPFAMMLDKEKYNVLPPFFHHGAPGIRNMNAAQQAGYSVQDFVIEDYLEHIGRGTCSRYGYNLSPLTPIQGYLTYRFPYWIYHIKEWLRQKF